MNADARISQSFGFSTLQAMMTPGKKAVLDAVNDLEQHRNDDRKPEFERALRDRVREYEAECNWNLLIMRGMAAGALGEFDEAIALVEQSLLHASSDQQRAISHSNIGDHCRRSNRFAEAVEASSKAFELWPSHEGIICNYALTLAMNGDQKNAARVLAVMFDNSDFDDPRDLVAAHLRHEEDMQTLVKALGESYDEE